MSTNRFLLSLLYAGLVLGTAFDSAPAADPPPLTKNEANRILSSMGYQDVEIGAVIHGLAEGGLSGAENVATVLGMGRRDGKIWEIKEVLFHDADAGWFYYQFNGDRAFSGRPTTLLRMWTVSGYKEISPRTTNNSPAGAGQVPGTAPDASPIEQARMALGQWVRAADPIIEAVASAKDKTSAETAAATIKAAIGEITILSDKLKAVYKLMSEADKQAIEREWEGAMGVTHKSFAFASEAAMANPEVATIIGPALEEFNKALQRPITEPPKTEDSIKEDSSAGGKNSGASYLSSPQPSYPPNEKKSGIQGTVLLKVTLDATGLPVSVTISKSSGSPALDETARATVADKWIFNPAMKNGAPIPSSINVPIEFRLR